MQSVFVKTEEVMGLSEKEENQECAARRGRPGRKEKMWVPEEEIQGERQILLSTSERPSQHKKCQNKMTGDQQ